jgi:serine/threonine protein kinase/tetratricopeptide (TPR) repeat protein
MVCSNCGAPVAPSDRSCPRCGSSAWIGANPGIPNDVTLPPTPPVSGPSRELADDVTKPSTPTPSPDITQPPSDPRQRSESETPRIEAGGGTSSGSRSLPGTEHATSGPFQLGTPFGRYHLIRLIGKGGMGAVYQAWDDELAVVVAIKMIRPDAVEDPAAARELERRFKRELVLARNITHKHVIRIHDLGEIDGIKYITMSYINGSDLATILKEEGRLSVPRALAIARQVAAGLAAAHDAHVVHRDLKPANILIDDADDRAVITDFGIARSASGGGGGTMAGTVIGTLEYMAPEQARGKPVDHRADIYAFGLMLSEMLVGRRRNAGGDNAVADLIERIGKPLPSLRSIDPTLPQSLDDIVARCCNLDPAQRYQRTEDLVTALEAVDGGGHADTPIPLEGATEPQPARPTTVTLTVPAVLTRAMSRKWLAAAALVVLATVGAAAVYRTVIAPRGRSSQTGATQSLSLAVLPFRNASGDSSLDWIGPSLAETMLTEIGQTSALRTIPASRMTQILKDLRISPDSNLDPVRLGRLAEFSNADTVLWGQYLKFGDEIRIDATLQNVKDQRSVTFNAKVPNESGLLDAVSQLATSVRQNLTLPATAIKELAATSFRPSSKSIEALRDYNEGLALGRQGRYRDAVAKFEAATQEDSQFALAYAKLAESHAALGERDDAERFARTAVALSSDLQPQERFFILAAHARIMNDTAQAIKDYESLDKVLPGSEEVSYELARLYEETGSLDAARSRYEKILADDPRHVDALLGAGRVATLVGNVQGGLEYFNKALNLTIEVQNKVQEAAARRALGGAYSFGLGSYDDARRYYQQALTIEQGLDSKTGIAETLFGLARVDEAVGNTEQAIQQFDKSLDLRREIGDQEGIADVQADLGFLYGQRGDFDKALDNYRQALAIYRRVGNKIDEGSVLNNVGNMYLGKGDLTEARTYFETALAKHEETKLPGPMADTLRNLAITATNAGQYDEAIDHYLKALDLRRSSGDREGAAIISYSLGVLYEYQGRFGAALQLHDEAISTLREAAPSGFPWLAAVLGEDGSALSQAGRSADAAKVLDEALAKAKEAGHQSLIAQIQNFQGDDAFYRGQWDQARTLYREALQTATAASDKRFTLVSRVNLAKVDIRERRPGSAARFAALVPEVDAFGLVYWSVESETHLGEAWLNEGNDARAREQLQRAISQGESIEARVLLARAHYLLSELSRRSGDAAEARRQLEQARHALDEIRAESKSDDILRRADLAPIVAGTT